MIRSRGGMNCKAQPKALALIRAVQRIIDDHAAQLPLTLRPLLDKTSGLRGSMQYRGGRLEVLR